MATMMEEGPLCPACGCPLPPPKMKETAASSGVYKIRATCPAPEMCPSGCQLSEMEMPLSLGMIIGFTKDFMRMAAREKGFFKKRSVCQKCGGDLVETGSEHTWRLEEATPQGGLFKVEITGPEQLCPLCQ